MGISLRNAGFWQRGFPLTTRVFFSHWPSQDRWQSHTNGLDSRLLRTGRRERVRERERARERESGRFVRKWEGKTC